MKCAIHQRRRASEKPSAPQAIKYADESASVDLRQLADLHARITVPLELSEEIDPALKHVNTALQQVKFLVKQVRAAVAVLWRRVEGGHVNRSCVRNAQRVSSARHGRPAPPPRSHALGRPQTHSGVCTAEGDAGRCVQKEAERQEAAAAAAAGAEGNQAGGAEPGGDAAAAEGSQPEGDGACDLCQDVAMRTQTRAIHPGM